MVNACHRTGINAVSDALANVSTDVCEGIADCVDACPVACIDQGKGKNKKGTDFYWINFDTCIDCGICLQVCPVEGAIVAEERPDLQKRP